MLQFLEGSMKKGYPCLARQVNTLEPNPECVVVPISTEQNMRRRVGPFEYLIIFGIVPSPFQNGSVVSPDRMMLFNLNNRLI
jgi:hypothetical protein